MNTKPKIIVRADGNEKIGLGHVYRALALCERLKNDFNLVFYIREPNENLKNRILQHCNSIEELSSKESYILEAESIAKTITKNDILVLDGYHFDTEYQKTIREKLGQLVVIDDIHQHHTFADDLFNFGGENLKSLYKSEFYTRFHFGFEYALLRKEFISFQRTIPAEASRVFICMGGADPLNFTLGTLKKCIDKQLNHSYEIVVGSHYIHLEELKLFLSRSANAKLHVDLNAEELVQLMSSCGKAICSASTISYEYLCTKGELFLIKTAENQNLIFNYLLELGLADPFENFHKKNESSVNERANKIELLLSKNRKFSYSTFFNQLFYENHFNIRHGNTDDELLYFNWANDPETRMQSFNSEPISLENHIIWFRKNLHDKNVVFYILEFESNPVGQLRFSIDGEVATINYSIDKNYRGKGIGKIIIKKATQILIKENPSIKIVQGFVKSQNVASAKAFLSNGFAQENSNVFESCEYRFFIKFS